MTTAGSLVSILGELFCWRRLAVPTTVNKFKMSDVAQTAGRLDSNVASLQLCERVAGEKR